MFNSYEAVCKPHDAKMTALTSLGEQEEAAQGLSATQHHDHLSRRSSEVEYEIAEQLIQHSQGRRDCNGANTTGSDKDRGSSLEFAGAATVLNG